MSWIELLVDLILTWFVGMFVPFIIRFAILRKPISQKTASQIAGINSVLLCIGGTILFEMLATSEDKKNNWGGYAVYFLLFWVNRWILTRKSKITNEKSEEKPILNLKQKISKFTRITIGLVAGFWFGIVWVGATYNMLKNDLENNLFNLGLQMFIARTGALFLITTILICSLYAFSYVLQKKWFVGIIRIIEWIISVDMGVMGIFGTFKYISSFIHGDQLGLSNILDNVGFVIACFILIKRLYKIPMTERIYENLKISFKNKAIHINENKEKKSSLLTTGTEKTCPECKKNNNLGASYCQECGFNFKNEEVQYLLFKNLVPLIFVLIILGSIFASHHFNLFNAFPNTIKDVEGSDMVLIPAGEFWMGSNDTGLFHDQTRHKVWLDEYYIDKYLVTFDQYDKFCEATGKQKPSDRGWGRGSRPVINVSWYDANAYATWIGKRLPTEAEWEKAARGGTDTKYFWGEDTEKFSKYAWDTLEGQTNDPKFGMTQPVGDKEPNPMGLYDIVGNVGEWCSDWFSPKYYTYSAYKNPQGPDERNLKNELKEWYSKPEFDRSRFPWLFDVTKVMRGLVTAGGEKGKLASRNYRKPDFSDYCIGFRCAKTP